MIMRLFAIIAVSFASTNIANAQSGYESTAPKAVIMDHETGIILYEKDARDPMIPASMTKIMTAYVAFDMISKGELALEDEFTVGEDAWRRGGWASGGSTMGLGIGERVTVENLLRGIIIQSGNDACIVLAEGIDGTEEAYAERMTQTAKVIGLETASFRNATGLDADEHRISPIDLAKLSRRMIEDFPNLYPLYAERSFTWNKIRQGNRNPLLYRFDGADGLKTGHLSVSGYGLVGSAVRDGIRRSFVINGLESERARADEAERIMNAAFRRFEVRSPYKSGDTVASLPVWLGERETIDVKVEQDVAIGTSRGVSGALKAQIILNEPVSAPVTEGDILGILRIESAGSGQSQEVPLYAASSVAKIGLMARAMSGLGRFFSPERGPTSAE